MTTPWVGKDVDNQASHVLGKTCKLLQPWVMGNEKGEEGGRQPMSKDLNVYIPII